MEDRYLWKCIFGYFSPCSRAIFEITAYNIGLTALQACVR